MVPVIHDVNIRKWRMKQQNSQRNPADFPILGVLSVSPSHGYDLCRELGERLGEIWTLRRSHIYALLAGLEKDGLVRHERVGQETRPTKKVYCITEEGIRTFLDWVRSPVEPVRDMRLEFMAKLHFARLESPSAVADLVADQLARCLGKEKYLREKRRFCKTTTERAALDFRLAMVEATVAWLSRLRTPDSGPNPARGDHRPGR
jgi:PadR family transcriptional regulator, regulatory protein AphA